MITKNNNIPYKIGATRRLKNGNVETITGFCKDKERYKSVINDIYDGETYYCENDKETWFDDTWVKFWFTEM